MENGVTESAMALRTPKTPSHPIGLTFLWLKPADNGLLLIFLTPDAVDGAGNIAIWARTGLLREAGGLGVWYAAHFSWQRHQNGPLQASRRTTAAHAALAKRASHSEVAFKLR